MAPALPATMRAATALAGKKRRNNEWRRRQRRGEVYVPVLVSRRLLEALIDWGQLQVAESGDRKQVGSAIAAILDDAVRHGKKM